MPGSLKYATMLHNRQKAKVLVTLILYHTLACFGSIVSAFLYVFIANILTV